MRVTCPILLLVVNSVACGSARESAQAYEYPSEVLAEVRRVLDETMPCEPRPSNNQTGNCQFVTVGFSPKAPSEKSFGQRILVLDAGMRFAAYTRYRSRVLDDVEPTGGGEYKSVQRPIEIHRGAFKILSDILNDRFPDVSAEVLNPVEDQFNKVFPNHVYPIRHGELIFGTLADLNPHAEFVIAQTFDIPHDLICHADEDLTNLAELKKYLQSASSSLKEIIRKYNISFVNLSLGHSMKTVADMTSRCKEKNISVGSTGKILDVIKTEFYDSLFSLRDVIFVQSGPWSRAQLTLNHPEFPIDCAKYPNRISVGYTEFVESTIPRSGSRLAGKIDPGQWSARKCIDVFFNTGVEGKKPYAEGRHPYKMTTNGIGSSSMPQKFCTSWAAPFVLSYLNFEKQSQKALKQDFAIDRLIGSNLVFDPFKYRQIEALRIDGSSI